MNGFSAADMSTAAANGFRDGLAAQPAAAQEAVAWQVGDEFYTSESLAIEGIQQWGPSGAIAIPLYAAPVVAAPVVDGRDVRSAIAGIEGSVAVGSDGEWVSVRRTARDAAVTALRNLSSDCSHIYAAYAEAKASTPAAPGIDLEQFREVLERDIKNARAFCDVKRIEECQRLTAMIDASPKGGINARVAFEEWAAGKTLPLHRPQIHIGMAGDYSDAWTHCAWTAWEAAMQATSAEVGA